MKATPVILLHCVLALLAVSGANAKPKPAPTPPASVPSPAADANATPRPLISTNLGGKDLEFLTTVNELGQVQTWLGEQAMKAETEQIKAVGEALKSTQTEENKQLTLIAARKGVNFLPPDKAPVQVKKLEADFAKLKGPKFDKAVIDQIIAANQQEVSAYEGATHSKDDDIKHFAEQVLPVAKEKLQLVEKMTGTAVHTNVTPGFRTGTPLLPKDGQ